MRAYRIYCSLLLGSGFTALVFLTMNITWILGIMLMMPGIGFQAFPVVSLLGDNLCVVIVGNVLFYSLIAALPVWNLTWRREIRQRLWSGSLLTIIVTTFVLTGWLGARALEQRGYGPCQNEGIVEIPSPDGKNKAVIFEAACGATGDDNVQVSILPSKKSITHADRGNAFSADRLLYFDWTSNNSVLITYPRKVKVFLKQEQVGNVKLSYIAK